MDVPPSLVTSRPCPAMPAATPILPLRFVACSAASLRAMKRSSRDLSGSLQRLVTCSRRSDGAKPSRLAFLSSDEKEAALVRARRLFAART